MFVVAMVVAGTVAMSPTAKADGPSGSASACSGITYTVLAGDGWMSIARKASLKLADLLNANAATIATVIHPDEVLCLPTGGTAQATTSASVSTPPAVATRGALDVFPVQGPCSYTDTYRAPRSGGRTHEGVDIVARSGQAIYSVKNGTLTKRYVDTARTGNGWRLTAPDGTYFLYAHLSTFAKGLSIGSAVRAGQIIGQVGMTGNALSPHLHFEVHPDGGASVDPTSIVRAVDACNVTDTLP
jgi:murein DD-endopeptidase MepM/ murein hydrolase activator NlpD